MNEGFGGSDFGKMAWLRIEELVRRIIYLESELKVLKARLGE